MNERIKELAEQAGMTQYVAAENKYLDKFAELIVMECVRVGSVAFCSDHSVVPVFPSEKIKEHFGVED